MAAARFKYGAITSALRSSLANLTHGMPLASAKEATARRNRCPILSNSAGEGNRQAQVLGHERDHLPAGLQDRHIGVEVDPVQALDVQLHMPAENLIHRHHACAHDTLRNHAYAREDEPSRTRLTSSNHAARRSEAEPHWYSSRRS